jgi:hypothetical protein
MSAAEAGHRRDPMWIRRDAADIAASPFDWRLIPYPAKRD